jgi:Pseudouridylate synthase
MISAAQDLVGIHDFRNFCKMDVGNGVVNYDREIKSVSIKIIAKDPLCPDKESGKFVYKPVHYKINLRE